LSRDSHHLSESPVIGSDQTADHVRCGKNPTSSSTSYGQILKSSSIIGGATGINYLVGMVRTKMVAVLLGTSGVGLVGIYLSITGTLASLAGLGIGSSGVREIAEAEGSGDEARMAATVKTLRRVCWITGLLGWLLSAVAAWPISRLAFGNEEHAWAIALLGLTILFGTISGGQTALLQGIRRIGDLARIQVIATVLGTLVTLGLYGWLREDGIVPVLISSAAVQLLVTWHFARKIKPIHLDQPWAETFHRSKNLISLGLAFMWSGLLSSFVALGIRALIVRELGLDANGIYQAAWGISGMFAGFILGAMGADFYPRLTAVAHDHGAVNRMVNEQTEIGVLLALPGLVATLAFAPWLMHVFYSAKFLPGAELLPWFVLGIFGQIVSWPMGYILLAKGEKTWFVITESAAHVLKFAVAAALLDQMGLVGTAIAYPILYLCHTVGLLLLSGHLTGFRWSHRVLRLLGLATISVGMGFAAVKYLPVVSGLFAGSMITLLASTLCLRGLAQRIGHSHRLIQVALKFPGCRLIIGSC
jgi:PST family polysaccharide transporter